MTKIYEILGFLVDSFWGGILYILIGVLVYYDTYKEYKYRKIDSFRGDLRGYIGGVGFVILGIMIIIRKIYLFLKDFFHEPW